MNDIPQAPIVHANAEEIPMKVVVISTSSYLYACGILVAESHLGFKDTGHYFSVNREKLLAAINPKVPAPVNPPIGIHPQAIQNIMEAPKSDAMLAEREKK